jgi:GxxExxY protein
MNDQRTFRVIGAAMEVHKELGCGFLEPVYQEALEIELASRQIPFVAAPDVLIRYKDRVLSKHYVPDFVCFNEIIVEIKVLSQLSGTEEAQVINYLKASGMKIGLLINFGTRSLQHKRLVYKL